jgi:two-component system sensor histidine kinase SenX3
MEVLTLLAVALVIVATLVAIRSLIASREASREATAAEREVRETRRSLTRSEEDRRAMELVLSSMRDGVLLFAADGRRVFANPALASLLGALPPTRDELLPLDLRHATERASAERTSTVAVVEVGSPARWLRGSATPVDDDGAVLLVVRDITEARRLEAVRRDFVANASHELKTPAASIQAAAETIGKAALDDPQVVPRFAAQLESEAVRLSRIVSDLLDLSRLEHGSELGEVVALGTIVHDELERSRGSAAAAGVTLGLRAPELPQVRGSARDLALMVRNLVDNAVRYTPPGGQVDVDLSEDDGYVLLTVTDTGVGIPGRDLTRVFERFYRVDRARSRETGGTGLGLSIVRHVAENHGGAVTVRSELGRGSTFEVRLPATPSA